MKTAVFWIALALVAMLSSVGLGALDREVAKERLFLMSAAQFQLGEIVLGEIATKQAGSSQVKEFGQRILSDHSRARAQLAELGKVEAVQLPTRMSNRHKELCDKLTTLSGHEFDAAYLDYMTTQHGQALKEFAEDAKKMKDPKIKRWAMQTLMIWQNHLQLADVIGSRVTMERAMRRP